MLDNGCLDEAASIQVRTKNFCLMSNRLSKDECYE